MKFWDFLKDIKTYLEIIRLLRYILRYKRCFMRRLIVLITVIIAITGCSSEADMNIETVKILPTGEVEPAVDPLLPKESATEITDYVGSLPEAINAASTAKEAVAVLENNLPLLASEQLDTLMMQLEDFYFTDMVKVKDALREANEAGMFENQDNPITEEDIALFPDEAARKIATDAMAGKYKFVAGEGIMVPIVDYRALLDYKSYLSPAMRAYLELMAIESDNEAVADGSIIVPWEQLGERALKAEAYLIAYPTSPRYDRVKVVFSVHLMRFFIGASNSFPFASGRDLEPEAKEAFDDMIASHGNTFTGKLTNEYKQLGNRLRKELPVAKESYDDPFYEEIIKFTDSLEGRIHAEFQGRPSTSIKAVD